MEPQSIRVFHQSFLKHVTKDLGFFPRWSGYADCFRIPDRLYTLRLATIVVRALRNGMPTEGFTADLPLAMHAGATILVQPPEKLAVPALVT